MPELLGPRVIWAVNRAKGQVTTEEVIRVTGMTRKQVSDHLSHAVRNGLVIRVETGFYRPVVC